MSKMPTKKDILDWISAHPTLTGKRDIAKTFHIKGAARINLKRLLKELEEEGHLEKRKKTYRDPDILPPVGVLQVKSLTGEGEVLARPQDWQGTGDEPVVLLIPRRSDPALGVGDRFLAKLTPIPGEEHSYEARLIRRIANTQQRILGVYRKVQKTANWSRQSRLDQREEWVCPRQGLWIVWAILPPPRRCR
jgi:ribonuclease R